MRTQRLLHPDHIMPCILLVTGSVKMCHGFITMLFVEGDAGRIGVRSEEHTSELQSH